MVLVYDIQGQSMTENLVQEQKNRTRNLQVGDKIFIPI